MYLSSQTLDNNTSNSSEDAKTLAKTFNLQSHSSETGTIPKEPQNENAEQYENKKRNWKTTELRGKTEKIAIEKTLEPTSFKELETKSCNL